MSKNNFLQSSPKDLQRAMSEVNRKMQEEEAQAKAGSLHLPYIDLHKFPVDLNVLGLFTREEAVASGAVPFYKEGTDLRIGVTNPEAPMLLKKIRDLSDKNKVTLYYISHASLIQAMTFFSKVLRPAAVKDETVRVEKELNYPEILKGLADMKIQRTKTATDFLELVFGAAVAYKSSDIHFEPEEHFVKLRFRIDGVLQDMLHVDKSLHRPVVARIKILSKLKLNVENVPQDGRLTFYYLTKPVDVRVSTLPSAYGEELVMRLLGTSSISLSLADLGLRPDALAIVEKELQKPNGMIITTGPTGSGKTTTLYAFLNELNRPGVKIITLEDPVEYKIEGIVQTPIDHRADFSFAKGLRAILRQDPDIVMVGEIRDQETAETASQAALTGHVVLSTLHTNDAAGAIPRLTNMGVKPFVLGPALNAIIAQRLVRKICQFCKKPASLAPGVMEKMNLILEALPPMLKQEKNLQFYHSTGCAKCANLGYSGRIGIYEVMQINEKIQDLIMKEATMTEFRKAATEQGMVTMVQDGLLKAKDGITDVEEVFRVAGDR